MTFSRAPCDNSADKLWNPSNLATWNTDTLLMWFLTSGMDYIPYTSCIIINF